MEDMVEDTEEDTGADLLKQLDPRPPIMFLLLILLYWSVLIFTQE